MNWLNDQERENIQKFKIPVDSFKPITNWIVSLDGESMLPTDEELKQIRSYCEYKIKTVYNESYATRLLNEDLPKESGHNTTIFRKGFRFGCIHIGWFYRRRSWNRYPTYVPDLSAKNYKMLSLVGVMNRAEDIIPKKWEDWKRDHNDIFPHKTTAE